MEIGWLLTWLLQGVFLSSRRDGNKLTIDIGDPVLAGVNATTVAELASKY